MKLAYRAFDKGGKPVDAMIDAAGLTEATEVLRRQGLYVTEIVEAARSAVAGAAQKSTAKGPRSGQRLRLLTIFSRQLYVLVSSGTPMTQALMAIERQTENDRWRGVLAGLRQRVEEGVSLSAAMEAYPDQFDSVCRSLVSAGESSGNMPAMLDRLSVMTRKQQRLRSTIIGAMVYPAVLIAVGACVLVTMLLFVVPRFGTLFETLDVPLPPTTLVLLAVSGLIHAYWWAILMLLLVTGVGARAWLKSLGGRRTVDHVVFKVPKFGKLVRNLLSARVARMLGALIESRVPLVEALQLTRGAAGNSRFVEMISRAEEAVTNGNPMSEAFADPDLVNSSVFEAIRHGEQSGQVGSLLLHIADFLDEENETVVKAQTSLIEPMILLALGVLVGFIALSMFIPLFDLAAVAQTGGGQ
ncbi:MAG: type II secretion system F family protein [Planctomycetes bacterium]|nr:type II secretion system F family protein [Planctomycetota bacterium]